MVKSLPLQIRAIIQKNTLCSLRNREILTETVLPLVAAIVVVLKGTFHMNIPKNNFSSSRCLPQSSWESV